MLVAGGVAACFPLDRAAGVAPGSIKGSAIRPDIEGRPGASFVRVNGIGSNLVRTGDENGAFVIGGLSAGRFDLRLIDDVDGNGWADRGREIALFVSDFGGAVGGIDVGALDLDGTFGLRGAAFIADGGGGQVSVPSTLIVRVYALRGRCSDVSVRGPFDIGTGACTGSTLQRIEHGIEAEAAADAFGDWQLTRVVAGAIDIVGVLYERNSDGTLGDVVDVAGPFSINRTATDDNSPPANDGPQIVFDDVPPPPVDVTLTLSSPVGDTAFAVFSRRGEIVGSCTAARDVVSGLADARLVEIADGTDAVTTTALPAGVWDVVVCDGGRRGATTSQLAYAAAATPRWPVVLLETDSCPLSPTINNDDDDDARDCDGDILRGLPLATFESLRAECALSCFPDPTQPFDSLGAALADRTCTVGGIVYDCDDDNDGQPDVTEPIACLGPGRGTDLDGDGICSIVDGFPHCAANDPALCAAGDEQVAPATIGSDGPAIVSVLADTAVIGCRSVGISDDGIRAVIRCPGDVAPFGDTQNQEQLYVVDLASGTGVCASCAESQTISTIGARIIVDASGTTLVFTTDRQLDFSDTANDIDLYAWNARTSEQQLLSVDPGTLFTEPVTFGARFTPEVPSTVDAIAFVDAGSVFNGLIGDVAEHSTGDQLLSLSVASKTGAMVLELGGTIHRVILVDVTDDTFDLPPPKEIWFSGETTAPVISSNGRWLVRFTTEPIGEAQPGEDVDLVVTDLASDDLVTRNLTDDIDGNVCTIVTCGAISVGDDGSVAWIHTNRAGGSRAFVSSAQTGKRRLLADVIVDTVNLSANGRWATITTSSSALLAGAPGEGDRVFRVDVTAIAPGGEGGGGGGGGAEE